jgi:hypothetical protein
MYAPPKKKRTYRSKKIHLSVHRHRTKKSRRPRINTPRSPNANLATASTLATALTRKNRISNVLKSACHNSTNCIALGMYLPLFDKLFDHFSDWNQLNESQIAHVGSISENGFALKLPFEKDGYTAHTILKSAQSIHSDNLVYEYLVGTKFINKMCDKFPCFLETYSLHQYKHPGLLYASKTYVSSALPRFQSIPFSTLLTPATVNWPQACANNTLFALLIQYFDNVTSFRSTTYKIDKCKYDIFQLLYQVYYVLDTLKEVYTHYDLHGENVLLYKPFDGNAFMKMHYHQPDGRVITIQSEWIVKLIDYGRNYFKTDTDSSESIIDDIVRTSECTNSRSVSVIKGKHKLPLTVHTDPTSANSSHDLQLLREIPEYLHNIRVEDVNEYNQFGFPEKSSNSSGMVRNVSDMRRALEEPANQSIMARNDKKYDNSWVCGGEMHIYPDGRSYTVELNPLHSRPSPPKMEILHRTQVEINIPFIKKHITTDFSELNVDGMPTFAGLLKWFAKILQTEQYKQTKRYADSRDVHEHRSAVNIQDKYRYLLVYYLYLYCVQTYDMKVMDIKVTALVCIQTVLGVLLRDLFKIAGLGNLNMQQFTDASKRIHLANLEIVCMPEHAEGLMDEAPLTSDQEIDEFNQKFIAPFLV